MGMTTAFGQDDGGDDKAFRKVSEPPARKRDTERSFALNRQLPQCVRCPLPQQVPVVFLDHGQ